MNVGSVPANDDIFSFVEVKAHFACIGQIKAKPDIRELRITINWLLCNWNTPVLPDGKIGSCLKGFALHAIEE